MAPYQNYSNRYEDPRAAGLARGAAFNKAVDSANAVAVTHPANTSEEQKKKIVENTKFFFEEFKKINSDKPMPVKPPLSGQGRLLSETEFDPFVKPKMVNGKVVQEPRVVVPTEDEETQYTK